MSQEPDNLGMICKETSMKNAPGYPQGFTMYHQWFPTCESCYLKPATADDRKAFRWKRMRKWALCGKSLLKEA